MTTTPTNDHRNFSYDSWHELPDELQPQPRIELIDPASTHPLEIRRVYAPFWEKLGTLKKRSLDYQLYDYLQRKLHDDVEHQVTAGEAACLAGLIGAGVMQVGDDIAWKVDALANHMALDGWREQLVAWGMETTTNQFDGEFFCLRL